MKPVLLPCLIVLAAAAPAAALQRTAAPTAVTAADHAVPASAVTGPFAIGSEVRDSSGAVMGRITRMANDKDGAPQVMVRKGVDSFAIPAGQLRMQDGVAVSARTREELKRGP
jgi:curli biogenesis system outer membrane secretion channel CsgG